MLILTRRTGESIVIGDDVIITIIRVVGNQVRLGIEAPKDIPIHREEIYHRIKNEQKSSYYELRDGDEDEEVEHVPD